MNVSDTIDFTKGDVDWTPISMYDLRDKSLKKTETYSEEEIIHARNIITSLLIDEDLEKYEPDLILMDKKNRDEKTIVVHAIVTDEAKQYDGNESRNRTFHIKDGIIVKVVKGQPKRFSGAPPPPKK